MKLKFRGYILYKPSAKTYFKDLVLNGSFGVILWTSLDSDAGLFDSKYNAIVAADYVSNTIKTPIHLRQLFRFEPDHLVDNFTQDNSEPLKREFAV